MSCAVLSLVRKPSTSSCAVLQQRALSMDPGARREAVSLFVWWTIVRAWEDSECRGEDKLPFHSHCLGFHFWNALQTAKAGYDWNLVREAHSVIREFAGGTWSTRYYPHAHRIHAFNVPVLPRSTHALWRPADDVRVERVAQLLEASAEELARDWHSMSELPWVYSEEFIGYPDLVGNSSARPWLRWTFYNTTDGWNKTMCESAPSFCRLLEGEMLGVTELPSEATFEDVVISGLPPGAEVRPHSGAPWRLNLHFGLAGITPKSYLGLVTNSDSVVVYKPWQAGIATPIFDDAYDHFVQIDPEAVDMRVVLHIGLLHPDVLKWKSELM
mmetsp:Transcript_142917/g.456614  ORF Transcript_142917/g.456614 Transcript_142917/m.456614 type:complete len:328 (+) Transcript_142917:369-1352(+)